MDTCPLVTVIHNKKMQKKGLLERMKIIYFMSSFYFLTCFFNLKDNDRLSKIALLKLML